MYSQSFSVLQLVVFLWVSAYLGEGAVSSLFQGSAYSGAAHRHRNKNWCAFIVQKNVSCAVQGNVESFVEPETAPCPRNQPDCEQQMMYRTRFRPTYRVSYKTVTELEWRCCPGYQGPDCKELKGSPNTQTVLEHQPQPQPQHRPGYNRNAQRPERRETGQYGGRRVDERSRQLEEEVQRLSQTVLDLQAAMTGMTVNLRNDLQEDTSKMLATLLNNMRPPDSAKASGTEESLVHLDGHQATRGHIHGERGMEEVLARLNDMTQALKSKDEAIEELRGAVTGHDGQIRMLMDASSEPAVTPGGSSDIAMLQDYIDNKFEKLKKELVVGLDDQIAKLKSECDGKVQSLQKAWEGEQEGGYTWLKNLVESKESELRKEIREIRLNMAMADGAVRTHRQTTPLTHDDDDDDHNNFRLELQRLAEAHRVLNARVDNELAHLSMLQLEDVFGPRMDELEARMNVTERNSEAYCFYVDEKITRDLADETAKIRQLLDDRVSTVEDQFTAMLVEISNSSFPGMFSDSVEGLQIQVDSNKNLIQGLEDKLTAIGQVCSNECKASTSIDVHKLGGLESIAKDVKHCRNELDVLNTDVENYSAKLSELDSVVDRLSIETQQNINSIKDIHSKLKPLVDNISGLTGAVTGLGDSMSKFSQDLQALNSSCCLAGQKTDVKRPSAVPSVDHVESQPSLGKVEELKDRLDRLSAQVSAELNHCKESTADVAQGVSLVDGRVAALEKLCERLNVETHLIQGVNKGLEKDLAQLNSTVQTRSSDINNLQKNLLNFQTQLATLKSQSIKQQGAPEKQERPAAIPDSRTSSQPRRTYIPEIHIPLVIPHRTVPVTPRPPVRRVQIYSPLQPNPPPQRRPVLETGEAGPPGFTQRLTLRQNRGTEDSRKIHQGYAGAPGYPQIRPVAYNPNPNPLSVSKVHWNPAKRLVATPVAAERTPYADTFSFSAGLTQQSFSGDFGIIRFNKVLVNDGGHYNPQTGIFTVPTDGRYLVTAVLTAPQSERVEAVLSVSERSVQRLDSVGHASSGSPFAQQPCSCGGSASVSLVLSLRAGDRVALVRTAGSLAASEAKEMLSTFGAVFLYSPPAHR